MATTMTQREAEKILGLTEAYTLADLKAVRKRHMAKFHPDKFHNNVAADGMTEAEAERIFISGNQAFDFLSKLFADMEPDYKVTPASEARSSYVPPRSTTTPGDAYGGASGPADATDGAHGATSASGTEDWGFYEWYNYYTSAAGQSSDYGNAQVADDADATGGSSWHGTGSHAARGRRTAERQADADWQYAYHAENAPEPVDVPSTGGGGCLFWFVLFGGLGGLAVWNQYDPKGAFALIANIILHPQLALIIVGILFFLYARGK